MNNSLYKIRQILHTGTRGEAGTQRHGGKEGQYYDEWTGMTVRYYDNGVYADMEYVLDKEGNAIEGGLSTSKIIGVDRDILGNLIVTTLNSVYYLDVVREGE